VYSTPPDTGKPDYGRRHTKFFLIISDSAPKFENNHELIVRRGFLETNWAKIRRK
jgi:hypothetical protein